MSTDKPQNFQPLDDVGITEPPDELKTYSEAVEYYSGLGVGLLKFASGTVQVSDQDDLLEVRLINYPSPNNSDRERPDPSGTWTDTEWEEWFMNGEDIGYAELEWDDIEKEWTWELKDSISVECAPDPGADNTLYVGAVMRKDEASFYISRDKLDYKVRDVPMETEPEVVANRSKINPTRTLGQWFSYRGIDATINAPGQALTDKRGEALRARRIEVVATNVSWSYMRPFPHSIYRPTGPTLTAAGSQWAFSDLPPGCIFVWQGIPPQKKHVVLAEAENPVSQLLLTRDQFGLRPSNNIYVMVNYPKLSLHPDLRAGTFDLHVRVLD